MAGALLSPEELTMLARLDLAHRRPLSGLYAGARRSPRFARSPEFADFRPYSAGDDFRQIDWKAYARLDRLLLRLYVAEEESSLNVVIDPSLSMTMGSRPKWPAAQRLAAALAFLGLAAMDRVAVGAMGGSHTPHVRGREGTGRLFSHLQSLEPGGAAGPGHLAATRWLRSGLVVVVSDFLTDEPWGPALASLRSRRMEPVLWQVLAPDEEQPQLVGDYKLVEVEAGAAHELTITPDLVADYQSRLEAHRSGLARAAGAAGGRFLHSTSDSSVEAMVLDGLRAGVVVRA